MPSPQMSASWSRSIVEAWSRKAQRIKQGRSSSSPVRWLCRILMDVTFQLSPWLSSLFCQLDDNDAFFNAPVWQGTKPENHEVIVHGVYEVDKESLGASWMQMQQVKRLVFIRERSRRMLSIKKKIWGESLPKKETPYVSRGHLIRVII